MPKPTLIALQGSSWSEKARWALDHHGIGYVEVAYTPMIDEPRLRWLTRDFTGRVSVPVLVTPHGVVRDSLRIARHAEAVGAGAPLFPREHDAAITEWNEQSETLLRAVRTRIVAGTHASAAAQEEALPPWVPGPVRPALRRLARTGASYLAAKYGAGESALARADREMIPVLDRLRSALAGRDTLLPEFSYADVAMAASLQGLRPHTGSYVKLGPATRAVWTHPELSARYSDLLEWRDRVYAAHRAPRGASRA